eukprot:m.154249 g.154249  ORF g.154249 m.154249 type:complete len:191 (-) comp15126_c0_seq3:826-1398(-)
MRVERRVGRPAVTRFHLRRSVLPHAASHATSRVALVRVQSLKRVQLLAVDQVRASLLHRVVVRTRRLAALHRLMVPARTLVLPVQSRTHVARRAASPVVEQVSSCVQRCVTLSVSHCVMNRVVATRSLFSAAVTSSVAEHELALVTLIPLHEWSESALSMRRTYTHTYTRTSRQSILSGSFSSSLSCTGS